MIAEGKMCKAKRYKSGKPNSRIDHCMVELINMLNMALCEDEYTAVACCCGHGKYRMSLLVREEIYVKGTHTGFQVREWFSNLIISRKRKFYKRDKQGYYYIPELQEVRR